MLLSDHDFRLALRDGFIGEVARDIRISVWGQVCYRIDAQLSMPIWTDLQIPLMMGVRLQLVD